MQKSISSTSIILFVFISILFFSCGANVVHTNTASVPNNWMISDTIQFSFEHTDTINTHDLTFLVRNNTDFEYQNAFFFVKISYPDGSFLKDTVECQLADYRGKWLGNGSGKIKEVQQQFGSNFKLDKGGIYQLEVTHAMRTAKGEGLKGIEDIGFQIIRKTN